MLMCVGIKSVVQVQAPFVTGSILLTFGSESMAGKGWDWGEIGHIGAN